MIRQREQGFSLVEVILALGILAGVLISIAGLFIMGSKQVKSGRTSTEALSVARAVLEEMDGWGFRQTYQLFGVDGTANTTATIDSRSDAYSAKWQGWAIERFGYPKTLLIDAVFGLVCIAVLPLMKQATKPRVTPAGEPVPEPVEPR